MKKKVLLITEKLEHYRVPLFNSLTESLDLTVIHTDNIRSDCFFRQEKLESRKIGPFIRLKFGDLNLEMYDIVIYPFNVRVLNLFFEVFKRKRYKRALFGIGVGASYSRKYDQGGLLDIIRLLYLRKMEIGVFYEKYPYVKYISKGIPASKLSVAYNTVAPSPFFEFKNKEYKSYVFIGSLYKEKKIFDLLEVYRDVSNQYAKLPALEIVGDGIEFARIKSFIQTNHLENKILLHGKIIDEKTLAAIMNRAIVCISPGQAGLSVQKSFSYGVGFVTTADAITGGELHSIIDSVNGNLYNGTQKELYNILVKYLNDEYAKMICKNAYMFYSSFRTINIWKKGFLKNMIE